VSELLVSFGFTVDHRVCVTFVRVNELQEEYYHTNHWGPDALSLVNFSCQLTNSLSSTAIGWFVAWPHPTSRDAGLSSFCHTCCQAHCINHLYTIKPFCREPTVMTLNYQLSNNKTLLFNRFLFMCDCTYFSLYYLCFIVLYTCAVVLLTYYCHDNNAESASG